MAKKTKSIVVQEEYSQYCFFCGSPTDGEHHLLFGTGIRNLAEEDGLKVPICTQCHTNAPVKSRIHDNPMAEKLSKMLGQAIYERNLCAEGVPLDEARELFRRRYGKSFW